jgi:Bacterial HORMA domain family 1
VLSGGNDDPGRVPRRVDVSGCSFGSYLVKSSRWSGLSESDRAAIERDLPLQRVGAEEPSIEGGGIWVQDRTYSSAGRGVASSKIAR